MKFLFIHSLLLLAVFASCKKGENNTPAPIVESATLDTSISAAIPHIYITTRDWQEITSKDVYKDGYIRITGNGFAADFPNSSTQIKGYGNDAWLFSKKPYRLNLTAAASMAGLPSAQDWVLQANFRDYSLMGNAVAYKAAQQLAMPYTNTLVPVDLTLNGVYQGSYTLTQNIDASEASVKIGAEGVLYQMDDEKDGEYASFTSAGLGLPMQVMAPNPPAQLQSLKTEFESLESLLLKGNYTEAGKRIDKQQVANYLLLNWLTANSEVCKPRNVYLFKPAGGKYVPGPVADFNWGFGYEEHTLSYFNYVDDPLLLLRKDDRIGGKFWNLLMGDPEIKSLFKQTWTKYKTEKLPELLSFIETYAARIRVSQQRDFTLWQTGPGYLPQIKADMKVYLRKRAVHLDQFISTL